MGPRGDVLVGGEHKVWAVTAAEERRARLCFIVREADADSVPIVVFAGAVINIDDIVMLVGA